MPERSVFRACPLCEAICGIEIKLDEQDQITAIKGDDKDPFSRGHVCPKAVALKDLHEDPDRLRQPLRREGDNWVPIGWDDAYRDVAKGLSRVKAEHGNNAVGVYMGNPSVHNLGILTHAPSALKSLHTRSRFSATSVDQLPHQLLAYWMFGHQFQVPIGDFDHADFVLMLGGNPMASNGSLMTIPDFRGRLKDLKARDGELVVIDPRRTETALQATQHHFIRPGTDAALLLAMLYTLVEEQLIDLEALPSYLEGVDTAIAALEGFTPEAASASTGIEAGDIRQLARRFAQAKSGFVYGRMGVSVQAYASVCHWAINMLNLMTGRFDARGGVFLPKAAWDNSGAGSRPGHFAAWNSRVSGLPEFGGELPASVMAEEILTPGEGQIRAMVTIAGNPVLSTPDGRGLDKALSELGFMVSIDPYLNETTRHAHIILPPTSQLQKSHYDITFNAFAIRNVTRFNEAVYPRGEDERHDWEILNGIGGALADLAGEEYRPLPDPEVLVDMAVKNGPYREAGEHGPGLSLEVLKQHPHGIDLGPLKANLPDRLNTDNKHIVCAPEPVLNDLPRIRADLFGGAHGDELLLIGRRHVRSNNSWMHNSHRLVKGKSRCTLMMHPDDAQKRSLSDGSMVEVATGVGAVSIALELSEDVAPGVVCMPHGWGHDRPGIRMQTAEANAGVSYNDLVATDRFDPVSGNAALNAMPVQVSAQA